jgi:hypothetical protein
MTDLHERFRDWLLAGAPGEPARDAALHASACDRCLADVAALDALLAVEVAGAEVPFLSAATRPIRTPGVRALRALSAVTAVGLLVLAAMIGAGAFRENTGGAGLATDPTESPDGEGILAGGPSSTQVASADQGSRSPTSSADEGASQASAVATGATPTQPPFLAPPPPAITPGPTTAATPRPTTAATPLPTPAPTEPSTATPTPTGAATPVPTPEPTPDPTPEPTPDPTPSEAPSPSEVPSPSGEAAP